MRKPVLPLLLLFGLAACSSEPELTETYREVEGNHTERWIWGGANPTTFEATITRIKAATGERAVPEQYDTITAYGPGNWIYEFVLEGDGAIKRAEARLADGQMEGARDAFLEASAYYQIAKFPYLRDENYEHYEAAYGKAMEAYEAAGAFFDAPLEVVEVPFGGGTIRGYLHLTPESADQAAPLIVVSGGIDVFKVEAYPMIRQFHAQGFSVLVTDLPGIGESNFIDAAANQDQVYSGFLDVLADDARIDHDRLGLFATSWGGNAAARIAFREKRFKGVVAACGPVHESLAAPQWIVDWFPSLIVDEIPPLRMDVLADRLGVAVPVVEEDYGKLSDRSRAFSLREQGLVGDGERETVPLLIINTNDDPFAPPSDMELLADSASQGELHYTGPGGHCGSRESLLEVSIPWLADKLSQTVNGNNT